MVLVMSEEQLKAATAEATEQEEGAAEEISEEDLDGGQCQKGIEENDLDGVVGGLDGTYLKIDLNSYEVL